MILPTMSTQEIADHICSEYKTVEKRILGRVQPECKTLIRLRRSTLTFVERTKNMTAFTTYIASTEMGLHTTGVWYDSPRGKVFAVASYAGVNFISKHFFERYAERLLNKTVPEKEAAKHFFYKNIFQGLYIGSIFGTEDKPNQMAVIYEQGVTLGCLVTGNNTALKHLLTMKCFFHGSSNWQKELGENLTTAKR
jgi:hypothetical protein